MTYILETKLSDNKSLFFALQNIYGINKHLSLKLIKTLGFSKNLKVKYLTENQIQQLLNLIENSNLIVTSDLKKIHNLKLKTLVSIKSYRGLRKIKGLPVRGQRTHTNSRTARKIRN